MLDQLAGLAAVFAQVGLIAVGGVIAVIPEIQRLVVDVHGWVDARSFATMFALAQAAPGPNLLLVTLIGWKLAGLPGAVVATASLVLPPAMMAYGMGSLWRRLRDWPWLQPIQAGLNAVTVGLIASAAFLVGRAAAVSTGAIVVTVVASVLLTVTRLHPLWVLAAGAILGAIGLI